MYSLGLITRRSGVQIPLPQPYKSPWKSCDFQGLSLFSAVQKNSSIWPKTWPLLLIGHRSALLSASASWSRNKEGEELWKKNLYDGFGTKAKSAPRVGDKYRLVEPCGASFQFFLRLGGWNRFRFIRLLFCFCCVVKPKRALLKICMYLFSVRRIAIRRKILEFYKKKQLTIGWIWCIIMTS